MGQVVFSRYKGIVLAAAILLGAAQIIASIGYDAGWGWMREAEGRGYVGSLALLAFVVLPSAVAVDGTRFYREVRPRARLWWYVGGLVSAVLGSVGVALGLLQVAIGAANVGEAQATNGTYLLALLGGLVFGVWVGAIMGFIGHLLGRLTLSLGL
jgi:hypothetical protein